MNKEIIKMNSVQQNEFLVWQCLEKRQIKKVYVLLDSQMPLTPFMLTSMVLLDYDEQSIINVLLRAKELSNDIFFWMKNHFEDGDLHDVFLRFQESLPKDYPSDDTCAEFGLWIALVQRAKWDVLAKYNIEIVKKYAKHGSNGALSGLLTVDLERYAPVALHERRFDAILSVKDGWRYLLEHDKKDFVFNRMKSKVIASILPVQEIFDYCREKGWLAEMYKEGLYSILLDNKEFSYFIEDHSLKSDFLHGYPQEVQWEDLWQYYRCDETYRNCLLEAARVNKDVPECKEFLARHTGFWAFLHR